MDGNGVMYVTEHSGTFNGTSTFKPGLKVIGSGWQINDLVFVYDYNGDGYDDLFGRRPDTGVTSVYFNSGGIIGTATFQAPVEVIRGGFKDTFQGIADVTMDGSPDFLFVSGGNLTVVPLNGDDGAWLGYGWETVDSIVLTDVDNDGLTDILGRRCWTVPCTPTSTAARGRRSSGRRSGPTAPVLVGTNWHINDIIS